MTRPAVTNAAGLLIFMGPGGDMRILDKLERRIGWFAIKNLTNILVVGNAAIWLMGFIFSGSNFIMYLVLFPSEVLKGEIWRIVSFIFTNSFGSSPISALIELYFLFMIGRNLEMSWGSFRLTVFYFIGFALTVAVSMITGMPVAGARYIHLSLFLAFARLAPEMKILLFFIIPIKIKWLAWAAWAFTAFEFITARSWANRLLILAPIAAFLLFFGSGLIASVKLNRKVFNNRRSFERKKTEGRVIKATFHKCEVCGLTEEGDPDMEFRYCSKCDGDYEYCSHHLDNHYHRSAR